MRTLFILQVEYPSNYDSDTHTRIYTYTLTHTQIYTYTVTHTQIYTYTVTHTNTLYKDHCLYMYTFRAGGKAMGEVGHV